MIVRVLAEVADMPGHWLCLAEPNDELLVLREAMFGLVIEDGPPASADRSA
jgi:hypothetical protein